MTGARPPVLRPGDSVALLCPSGPARTVEEVQTCEQALRGLGLEPRLGEAVFDREEYLAGSPERRAADLQQAFEDPAIRAIFAVRGGYGASTTLPLLDFSPLARDPKLFVGFSDLTALHAAIRSRTGLWTLHAPTIATAFVNEGLEDAAARAFERVLFDPAPLGRVADAMGGDGEHLDGPDHAEGWLYGGNLTVLASLAGTGWLPDLRGALLFLEDVNEEPYRLDRAATQLRQSGALDGLAGVVLGRFQGCDAAPGRGTAEGAIRRALCGLGLPIRAAFPAGHCRANHPLPLGARARWSREGFWIEDGFAPPRA